MKRILIFLILVLSAGAFAQPKQVILNSNYGRSQTIPVTASMYYAVSVLDSGAVNDTLLVYAVYSQPYREVLLSGVNQDTRKSSKYNVPGAGNPQMYNYYTANCDKLKIKLSAGSTGSMYVTIYAASVDLNPTGNLLDSIGSGLSGKKDKSDTTTYTGYATRAYVNATIGDTSKILHLDQNENMTGDLQYKLLKTTPVAVTNDTLFATTGSVFTKTLSSSVTFKISGLADGQIVTFAVTNTASNYTVAWSALGGLTLYWSGGSAPTQTTGAKTDVYSFQRIGNNIFAAAIQNF